MTRFERRRLYQIFEGYQNKPVLVVGDLMVDEYLRGIVRRLSPEAPVPIVEIDHESYHFGGAANVALNLKILGCKPITIGIIGKDRAGNILEGLMKEHDLSTYGLVWDDDRPTTLKTRIIGDNQHIARVDREKIKYIDGKLAATIKARIDGYLPECKAVVLEDYNKGVLTKEIIDHVIEKAMSLNKPVLVDPKFIHFMDYKGVTLFKPNLKETVNALARPIETEEELLQAGNYLLEELKAESVLITRGGQGMTLFESSGRVTHIPTSTRQVADVSGAGDTVISTLAATLVGGATFQEAATIANYAAGLVCEQVGIVPVEKDMLLKTLLENQTDDA